MKMLTYLQYIKSVKDYYVIMGYDFDDYDIKCRATPEKWHEEILIPYVLTGDTFSRILCRSIAKHGYHRLEYFAKNYPHSIPDYTDIKSGKMIDKKDLTHTK